MDPAILNLLRQHMQMSQQAHGHQPGGMPMPGQPVQQEVDPLTQLRAQLLMRQHMGGWGQGQQQGVFQGMPQRQNTPVGHPIFGQQQRPQSAISDLLAPNHQRTLQGGGYG